ncbi:hypothetical protein AJ79_09566 [Helicocarpus griseus UAMH5409]|uniref:DNA topoisomerase n=1 Tax=Helicocarpus griseus UAMH5409 TaxID=1447875 RepID=A0A2B7WIQ0_9EURO|nr:hypothetical protein AJ79_09566 [Helicocarpus griseus UAMH5409]
MVVRTVLCVAEKPSIAKAIANHLGDRVITHNIQGNPYVKNYEFDYTFPQWGHCSVTMTSVLGHLLSHEFEPQYKSWTSCDPSALFDARIEVFVGSNSKPIADNIKRHARRADVLFIWTDCDREGEHIGTEIRSVAAQSNQALGRAGGTVRAHFSNIERTHIIHAAHRPAELDEAQANAVASRIELDLRVGASFTRHLTLSLRPVLQRGNLSEASQLISYGSCQFPTLGFIVERYWRVRNFIPEPFWSIKLYRRAKIQRIDYVGTMLFVGSATSLLIPVTWGGVMYSWISWRTLVPMLIGAVGLIAFILYEMYMAVDPLIPIPVFDSRTAIVAYIGTALHGFVLWCLLYYMPLYFEAVKEYGPIISGVALFPETFTVAPTAILIGVLTSLTGRYQWSIYLGWFLATVGMGLFCVINVNTSVVGWIFLMLLSGIGLGMLLPALGYSIQASAKPEYIAIAVGLSSFFRAFGQAIGVAVGGVVFQNRMRQNLMAYPTLAPLADQYSKDAAGLVEVIRGIPDTADKQNLKQAYTDSLRIVWAVCCIFMGIGGILSLLSKEYDLNQTINTDQGIRRKETNHEH